jgi:hypothetical protein
MAPVKAQKKIKDSAKIARGANGAGVPGVTMHAMATAAVHRIPTAAMMAGAFRFMCDL